MFDNPVAVMALLVFILGISIGSFLNVVIYRLPRRESLVRPPSHCPNCNHRLGVRDLVPVFSYLLLGRKCRYCAMEISARYAIVESMTGIVFLLAFLWKGLSIEFVGIIALSILIIVLSGVLFDRQKQH